MNSVLNIQEMESDEIIKLLGPEVQKLAGKTVVITGANGVVASYIVQVLFRMNETILKEHPLYCICIVRHPVTKESRIGNVVKNKHFTILKHDITKKFSLPREADYIIHSASYASPKSYLAKPIETMEANSVGTKNMLEHARVSDSKNMMFISSGAVYGEARPGEPPFAETYSGNVSPLDVRAVYSESKRFGETLCVVYKKYFNVYTTIARLSNMYGPGFALDDGRAIPDFFQQALHKGHIILGNPYALRAYVYISDAILGFFHILLEGKSGEAYNISNETPLSMYDIAVKISKLFTQCDIKILDHYHKQYLIGSVKSVVISSKKLRKAFGWKPRVDMDEGLRRLNSWYQTNNFVET